MATRIGRRHGIAAGLVVVATALSACGSGSPQKTSTSPAHGQPHSGSATPSAGSSASSSLKPAPKALQALPLLKLTELSTAIGTPLNGLQDDGGTSSPSGGFVSVAETESHLTKFRISLQSYANPAAAMQVYKQLTVNGGTPLPGIGDKALDSIGTQVIVLKASQVLTVNVNLTSAGEDYLGQNDKSTESLLTALDKPARAAAQAIAAQLTGSPAIGSYLQLPAGALDPCKLSANAISTGTKQDVTAVNASSENRPAQQCDIKIGDSRYLVQTYTSAQATAAVPSTSLAAVYAQDASAHTPGEHVHTESANFMAFANIDEDFSLELLVTGAQLSSFRAAPETAHQALIRIKNAYTAPVSREQCYELGKEAAMQLVVGMPEAEAKKFFDELVDWCSKFPKGGQS